MDLSNIKSKLAALQSQKGKGGQKKDFSLIFWKPTPGTKQTVRIVPTAHSDIFKEHEVKPFKEIAMHYGVGRTMISLINFGEKDPIVELAKQLQQDSSPETKELVKKLFPKTRVFVPVLVRGEEEKGVRLWEFGKQIYNELLSIAEDEDIGDYTDPVNGRDITIETTSPEQNGTSFNQSKVRVRTKQTPLSDDAAEVKKWLSTQPNPLGEFKKYAYDEMKGILAEFLNPEAAGNTSEEVEAAAPSPVKESSKKITKKSVDEDLDELFKLK